MTDSDYFHIYALMSCPYCKRAVDLLRRRQKIYTLTILDNDPNMLQIVKEKYNHPTVPVITKLNESKQYELVGGFTELDQLLNEPQV